MKKEHMMYVNPNFTENPLPMERATDIMIAMGWERQT